jgi:DNA-binding transcriptional regulator GbsR (MarR family)
MLDSSCCSKQIKLQGSQQKLMKPKKILPEIQELASLIGDFIQYWGFKKIHGRIWTHIYLSEHPLDAAEIMKRTKISKALASMSLRDLMNYEVIQECGKSERGTTLYRANPDLINVILSVLRRREKKMLATISTAHSMVSQLPRREKEESSLDEAKIQQMGELIQTAENSLEAILQLREINFGSWEKFNASKEKSKTTVIDSSDLER